MTDPADTDPADTGPAEPSPQQPGQRKRLTRTLGVYDRILVQKAFFSWHDVHEGDIVVFSHPPLDQCPGPQQGDLVKRVIALPGQPPIASSQHPYRVPPGEFYVLGDNRADSCDSRYWGPIKGSSIVGKVVLMLWHDGHPDFH